MPSLILAKTAEVVGQALLLATGILVAWATGVVGWSLLGPMCYLLVVEVIGVGGFILAQVAGGVGRAGRLLAWAGAGRGAHRVDGAVREFYRSHWRSLLVSVGLHFASWLVGTMEVLLILRSLHVEASVATATVIEALGTGVRFATFFVPASLGTLEGANAAAFTALGWAASDGTRLQPRSSRPPGRVDRHRTRGPGSHGSRAGDGEGVGRTRSGSPARAD